MSIRSLLPLWQWSPDPVLHRAGELMLPVSREVVESFRLQITEGCQLNKEAFDQLKKGYLDELEKPGVHTCVRLYHNWAWKKPATSNQSDGED